MGYIVTLGSARCIFLSQRRTPTWWPHRDLLLEIDESQDVSKVSTPRSFRPMGPPPM
jgi:hypothetical protein